MVWEDASLQAKLTDASNLRINLLNIISSAENGINVSLLLERLRNQGCRGCGGVSTTKTIIISSSSLSRTLSPLLCHHCLIHQCLPPVQHSLWDMLLWDSVPASSSRRSCHGERNCVVVCIVVPPPPPPPPPPVPARTTNENPKREFHKRFPRAFTPSISLIPPIQLPSPTSTLSFSNPLLKKLNWTKPKLFDTQSLL